MSFFRRRKKKNKKAEAEYNDTLWQIYKKQLEENKNQDKYESIKADNEDYFKQGEEEDE